MTLLVGTAVVAAALLLLLAVLTALGSRRRGASRPVSVLAGAAFPATWTFWYVRDEHPYHRTHPHHTDYR